MKTMILLFIAVTLYVALVATQDALTSIKMEKVNQAEMLNRY